MAADDLPTDEELAAHPDTRVDPGICGVVVTHTVEGAPLAIPRISILPPHDPGTRTNRGRTRDGYYPVSERHYLVTRWPNRDS
jgi:hypothetical protein